MAAITRRYNFPMSLCASHDLPEEMNADSDSAPQSKFHKNEWIPMASNERETTAQDLRFYSSKLESLAPELLLMILNEIATIEDLSALIHASPVLHRVYIDLGRASILAKLAIRKLNNGRIRCTEVCRLLKQGDFEVEREKLSPQLPHLKDALMKYCDHLCSDKKIRCIGLTVEESIALFSVEHMCRHSANSRAAKYVGRNCPMEVVVYGKGYQKLEMLRISGNQRLKGFMQATACETTHRRQKKR